MGLFKKLFAKQAGGSIIGNVLRGVGDKFTGGAYSQIFTKPKGAETAAINLSAAKMLTEKSNTTTEPTPTETDMKSKLKKFWPWIAGGVAAVGVLIWSMSRGKKGGKRSYR